MNEREAFEVWAARTGHPLDSLHGEYFISRTHSAHLAWQARAEKAQADARDAALWRDYCAQRDAMPDPSSWSAVEWVKEHRRRFGSDLKSAIAARNAALSRFDPVQPHLPSKEPE